MSNLNTNYENMKKYKFETLFIKVKFKHENTCLKHDLWKISSPTVSPRALCSVRSQVPWPLVNWNFGPGCISGQKHQGSDETPLGRMQQTPCGLSPWADGPGNVGKSCGCCDDPCTPRDLNNSHTCHPTYPNIRPKDLVHRESRHHPRGVSTDT